MQTPSLQSQTLTLFVAQIYAKEMFTGMVLRTLLVSEMLHEYRTSIDGDDGSGR